MLPLPRLDLNQHRQANDSPIAQRGKATLKMEFVTWKANPDQLHGDSQEHEANKTSFQIAKQTEADSGGSSTWQQKPTAFRPARRSKRPAARTDEAGSGEKGSGMDRSDWDERSGRKSSHEEAEGTVVPLRWFEIPVKAGPPPELYLVRF